MPKTMKTKKTNQCETRRSYEPREDQRRILEKLSKCDVSEGCLLTASERRNVGVLVVMGFVSWVQPFQQPKKRIYFLTDAGRSNSSFYTKAEARK